LSSRINSAFAKAASDKVDMKRVDFTTDNANEEFNAWVKEKTRGAIKVDGNFEQNTKLSLASAIYFSGKWLFEFPESQPKPFTTPDGETKDIPMMSLEYRRFKAGDLGDYATWLSIPYKSYEAMLIVLPNRNHSLDEVIDKIDEKQFVNLMAAVGDEENEVR
jgi:serine protease inhibitor